MRLDKFLKISLIFKTRSSAEKAIEKGNLLLNGSKTKPSSKVKEGDILKITSNTKIVEYKILEIKEKNVSKKEAKDMTEIISEEKIELF